ncbi:MAG TPA: chromate efflux transporter [Ignavibacteria bacterium]|nr:chromate efflux transporter [Ignavibacteria bacterium]
MENTEKIITTEKPSFREAFRFWLKLGFISFGGPAGQIAIMHEYVVEKKKWLSESKFLHALNYCMLLPGPEAQQLATYIGWLLHKTKGGLTAGILFVLPSSVILLILSILYVTFGKIPAVYAVFDGLKPAVVAIVIVALIKISQKSLKNTFSYIIAIASFTALYFFNVPFPVIIIFTAVIAFIINKINPALAGWSEDILDPALQNKDNSYFINNDSNIEHSQTKIKNLTVKIFTGVILWTIPVIFLNIYSPSAQFWNQLILFFTKAAFVTFGGAYSVLPYVAQISVEQFHWLTSSQMIDGLALGETTPGPLIMVLSFTGFMAGYNHFSESVMNGTIGLFITTYYTFLPSFLFIFIGAPLIEKTSGNLKLKFLLNSVTAAVVGVILNLTIYFAETVIFQTGININNLNYFGLVWIIISFIALYFYKINMIQWICISAVSGLAWFIIK